MEIEKSVEVAKEEVEEPMAKAVRFGALELARKIEKRANGEVVPMPTLPDGSIKKEVVEEPTMN